MDKLRGLGGAIQVAAVISAVGAYMRLSDGIATANAQLKLATRTQAQLVQAQRDAYAIAQKQGVAYNAMATLLAKTTKSATAMGNEMGRAMEIGRNATAAIAAGIKVSGTGAQAASAGVFQLSQALASGTLRGDELNSVLENIPAIGDAIAKQMGVTTGQLRKMGAEGKLSSEAIVTALEKARPELEKMADMMPQTFGQAFEKIKNAAGRLFTEMDNGNLGFGKAMIVGLNLIAKALDSLATHAAAVSNVLVGVFVAASVKTMVAATAAGAAAKKQAADNLALAASAVAAAEAQFGQATAALAVARAQGAMSQVSASQAAANVAASAAALGRARAEAQAAGTALAAATTRASLFGRALTGAATLGRAALALVGGPIGLVITGLIAIGLWAGKAALSFKPIAGEAATVSDYVMEAFSQMGDWVSKVAGDIWKWMKDALQGIGKNVRTAVVWYIDAWLSLGRAVAGVVGGIVAAWKEGFNQIGKMIDAMKTDAQNIFSGNWGAVGATSDVASGISGAIGGAFSRGYQGGSSIGGGVSGEKIVGALEALPGQIGSAIMNSDYVQGLRGGANERARRRAQEGQGGAQDPGDSTAAAGNDGTAKKAAEDKKKTFSEILDLAKEEARLATLTSNEQEVQNALAQARVDLERKLTETEEAQLSATIRQKQANAANLALAQQTQQVVEDTAAMRMQAVAEEARRQGDFMGAAAIEAELRVQEMLNQAKRDGVELDAAKVEAYRNAVVLAAQESEVLRLQAEAKRALQEIADNARRAMQTAVSDGIYAALSGEFNFKDFIKTIGNILRRQLAETITAKLFGNQAVAQADAARVTAAALSITNPAANAVTAATNNIVNAMNAGANRIATAANDNIVPPIADAGQALTSTVPDLQQSTQGWVDTLGGALGPLGNVIGQFINLIASAFKGSGGGAGGAAGAAGGGGLGAIPGQLGIKGAAGRALSKGLAGAQTGMIVGAIGNMISKKFSQTGSTVGGAIGSFIPIPGGSIIGSVLGGIIGGLFKKTPKGMTSITNSSSSVTGNTKDVRAALDPIGGNVQSGVARVAQALGAKVGEYNVSVGKYKDEFRVSKTGSTAVGNKTYVKRVGQDAAYVGKDEAEATRIAILTAIQQGAIVGIREGAKRLLQAGKDIDVAVQKALSFENVFKRLKQWKDPVGAAVDAVDREFKDLKEIFKEAGASAEEWAQLEELYGKERAKAIEDATKNTTDILRSFIDDLKGGPLGGQSLTDQVSYQNKLFTAIEEAQKAGKAIDYNELNTVGRALIDATRELEGATPAFYDQVDRVMSVLEKAIADGNNPNVSTLPTPIVFREEVAVPVVDSIYDLNGNLVAGFENMVNAINAQTVAMLRSNATSGLGGGGGGGGGTFGDNWNVVNF